MRCDEVRERAALHALDLLDPAEGEALRAHLEAGCPGCEAELAAARAALDLLPHLVPPEEPSPMAKARLMAAVRKDRAAESSRIGRPAGTGARAGGLAAAAAILAALLTGTVMAWRSSSITTELRSEIRAQREELARLELQVRRTRDTIQLVRSPGSRVIDLAGQAERAESAARIFWDVRRGSWKLYADNLPPAGPGKTYQLWMVTAGSKISAGTFDPSTGDEATGRVEVPTDAGAVVAAGVTLEPAGGSPQPTTGILLLGKI